MDSILLSNPIYQHSGESEKFPALAQQASLNEDQEQRRRQLDQTGEQHKKLLAKEVSHIVDQFGGNVHLNSTPYDIPSKPILQQATEGATSILSSALSAGKSIFSSALDTATTVASSALDTATTVASSAINTASHVGHDAAVKANELAHEAANQASTIASKMVDTTSSAAGAVTQKTKEIASVANDKAHEMVDNISHFTNLVAVLAEEENERARRMTSGDEARAAANAFRVSELIRDLGESFYKQPTPNLLYATKILEESERRWRLNKSFERAEANAHKEGKLVRKGMVNFMPRYKWARKHIATLEEKERTRRLNSPSEAWAIINGLNTAFLIRDLGLGSYRQEGTFSRTHAAYATTLLEENERRDRIRTHNLLLTHGSESSSVLSDVVANNVDKLTYSTRNAAKFANEFASLLGNATLRVASQFSSLTKDFASGAAERMKEVAGDLRNFTTIMYVVALEERERARRLSDADEITAISNAWFQSQLIRDLSSLYKPSTSIARFPLGLIEEQERRWRLTNVTPSASRTLASFVKANSLKFESAMQRAADKDAAALSRLNPRAPAFVPAQSLAAKVEPAPIQPSYTASRVEM